MESKRKAKIASHILVSLLTDAFPTLRLLGQILLVCPLGTANVERSFSVMSRICNRLRQRLTADHLNHLVLISIEGPDVLTEQQLEAAVYQECQTFHPKDVSPERRFTRSVDVSPERRFTRSKDVSPD